MIRNLEITGEAARHIETNAPEFARQHDGIRWPALYAMRNRVSQSYWSVDLPMVWQVVERDLPDLEKQLRALGSAADPSRS